MSSPILNLNIPFNSKLLFNFNTCISSNIPPYQVPDLKVHVMQYRHTNHHYTKYCMPYCIFCEYDTFVNTILINIYSRETTTQPLSRLPNCGSVIVVPNLDIASNTIYHIPFSKSPPFHLPSNQ
jgi:hypothetical protein